jgi:hypothetical protein
MTGLAELDRQNWRGKIGQAEQSRQIRTVSTELPAQGCQHRAARIRQQTEGQKGEDQQKRTARKV